MKNLNSYIGALAALDPEVINEGNRQVVDITNDSRKVREDSLFIAIRGEQTDGHLYIEPAIGNGANTVVCNVVPETIHDSVTYIKVHDPYHAYALLAECYFAFPACELELIGITGTNGKTSSAFLMRQLLDSVNRKCGLISTVEYAFGSTVLVAERTTPEAYELQSLFRRMADEQCEYAVMEVSSHALSQHRPGSAKFAGALFTNLTGDHLDYHGDMDSYFDAKSMLFDEYLREDGVMAVNVDDSFGRRLVDRSDGRHCLSFGRRKGSFCEIRSVQSDISGSVLELAIDGKGHHFKVNLIGTHNACNVAGVLALAAGMGFDAGTMIHGFEGKTLAIPGRLEGYAGRDNLRVFVDYAHTDDALEKVLANLRPLSTHNLTVVFGCGGDRDKTKRPRMGAVAAKFADKIILTNDNPRSETPESIIEDILGGIPKEANVVVLPDRAGAIRAAITDAQPNDVVLIAGKGHETYQIIGRQKLAFSDCEEVQRLLNSP